jgi:transcriptional regulator with XRE-family HTH domain
MSTLREARLQALLSIRQLARKAGVSPTTIYLLEGGRHAPQLLTAYKLSHALGVDPAEIEEFHAVAGNRREARQREQEEHA